MADRSVSWTPGRPVSLRAPGLEIRSLAAEDVERIARRLTDGQADRADVRAKIEQRLGALVERQDHRRHFALGLYAGERKRIAACIGLTLSRAQARISFAFESRAFRDGEIPATAINLVSGFILGGGLSGMLRFEASAERPWTRAALAAAGFVAEADTAPASCAISAETWRQVRRTRSQARERDRKAAAEVRRALAEAGDAVPVPGSRLAEWPAIPDGTNAAIVALAHELERLQWWPESRLAVHQFRQAERLLEHAGRTVPFYRGRLEPLSAADVTADAEDWRELPILTRADIQQAGDALRTEDLPAGHGPAQPVRTSGSTGRPIEVRDTRITRCFFGAMQIRYHRWHHRDFTGRVATIRSLSGRMAQAERSGRPARWLRAYPSGPMVLFDITRPVSEQLDWLIGQDADYLVTFPSNLAALLERSERTGRRPDGLKHVVTMSEIVEPRLRAACARVWGVPLVDSYSSEELGVIAAQCPDHAHYHVMAENLLVELLDDRGLPVAPGEVGRVVVTDLHNFATPLIRYEIGDYAEAGAPCPCGRGLPVINRVLGRTRNMMTLPGGETFWPSLPEDRLMPLAPIRQFQVVQKSLDAVEVKLAVERPITPGEEDALRTALVDLFRHPFEIRFVYVEEIGREANGKYEDFKSEIG